MKKNNTSASDLFTKHGQAMEAQIQAIGAPYAGTSTCGAAGAHPAHYLANEHLENSLESLLKNMTMERLQAAAATLKRMRDADAAQRSLPECAQADNPNNTVIDIEPSE